MYSVHTVISEMSKGMLLSLMRVNRVAYMELYPLVYSTCSKQERAIEEYLKLRNS